MKWQGDWMVLNSGWLVGKGDRVVLKCKGVVWKKNDWIVWECRWVVWKGGWMAGMCFLIVSLSFSWLNKRSLACFWSKQYNGAFQILKHERISHVDFLLSFRMIALTGCLLHLASWNIFRTYGCLHGCLIFFRIFTFFL